MESSRSRQDARLAGRLYVVYVVLAVAGAALASLGLSLVRTAAYFVLSVQLYRLVAPVDRRVAFGLVRGSSNPESAIRGRRGCARFGGLSEIAFALWLLFGRSRLIALSSESNDRNDAVGARLVSTVARRKRRDFVPRSIAVGSFEGLGRDLNPALAAPDHT